MQKKPRKFWIYAESFSTVIRSSVLEQALWRRSPKESETSRAYLTSVWFKLLSLQFGKKYMPIFIKTINTWWFLIMYTYVPFLLPTLYPTHDILNSKTIQSHRLRSFPDFSQSKGSSKTLLSELSCSVVAHSLGHALICSLLLSEGFIERPRVTAIPQNRLFFYFFRTLFAITRFWITRITGIILKT